MHLVPSSHITIAGKTFEFCHQVEIASSWKMLTDTAEITLPANIMLKEDVDQEDTKRTILDHIPSKAPVTIELSANGKLQTYFKGYVTRIHSKVPLVFECEDEMHQLKKNPITYSGKKETLKGLLKTHFSQYKHHFIDVELGNYLIDNATPAQVLEALKKDFGLHAFFRDGVLCVGTPFNSENQQVVKINLDNELVEENLEFLRAEDVRVKVKATSHQPDGSKIEVTVGDDDGEQRTLNFFDVPKSELKGVAQREMQRFKYDGWRGDFTILGLKKINHGDVVELNYTVAGELNSSKYYADKLVYTAGVNGLRQKVELGMSA